MYGASEHDLVDATVVMALREFRMPGEPDPAQAVVEVFLEVTPDRLARLRRAAQDGNAAQVRAMAHTLGGSSGAVGAVAMHAVAADIEALAPSADPEPLMAELEALFARTRPMLESLAHGAAEP
jgi:HPt (histidine-containing phosphotransfer) domain-containing protein